MIRALLLIFLLLVAFWLGNLTATGKIHNFKDIDSLKSCVVSLGKTCPDISPVFN